MAFTASIVTHTLIEHRLFYHFRDALKGEIPPQKWTNFHMKVLTKLVSLGGLKLTVTIESSPDQGVTDQQLEETWGEAGCRNPVHLTPQLSL